MRPPHRQFGVISLVPRFALCDAGLNDSGQDRSVRGDWGTRPSSIHVWYPISGRVTIAMRCPPKNENPHRQMNEIIE